MIRPPHFRLAAAASFLAGVFLAGCAVPESKHVQRSTVGADLQNRGLPAIRADGTQASAQLPPGVSLGDGLSAGEAVATALWNNAAFQENLSKLGLARGDLVQAGLLANPTLSMLFPLGPKQLEFTAAIPFEGLWLRSKRIAIAEIEAERVAHGLVQSGLDLARDVRMTFSDVLLARDREAVAAETLTIREQIVRIGENRQRLGEASDLETASARAELARARDEAGRAQREHAMARERLSVLLGSPVPAATALSFDAPPTLAALPSVTALEAKALSARPDLRASELALEAAGRRAGLAEKEAFTLSGLLDANAKGKEGFEMGPGVALPLPIFNRNEPNRLRAKAEVERAGWNYLGTRQRIVGEVREARAKLEQAAATLAAYEGEVLPPFAELERTARRAYELGEVSPLVVQENARQLLLLQVRRAELRAEVRRAWAELERSVGTHL
ncbi:MAG TPA: TolC family protein [Opitutaceae bacterium]|nr:TolC family protein [Opitutaceae bacterium]